MVFFMINGSKWDLYVRLGASDFAQLRRAERGQSCFISRAEVQVIHGVTNFDAKMHVRKSFLQLYAFLLKFYAFIRFLRIENGPGVERKTLKTDTIRPTAA
jgi:hypothetical protein